jgi:hypothetical protein
LGGPIAQSGEGGKHQAIITFGRREAKFTSAFRQDASDLSPGPPDEATGVLSLVSRQVGAHLGHRPLIQRFRIGLGLNQDIPTSLGVRDTNLCDGPQAFVRAVRAALVQRTHRSMADFRSSAS